MAKDANTKLDILIDAADFTYSGDATDATADLNTEDVTKGIVAYSNSVLVNDAENGWTFLTGENETALQGIANVEFMPPTVEITVRYVDASGRDVRDSSTHFVAVSSAYTITPANVFGYTFVSSDKELTGTTDTDMVIILTYSKLEYTITLKFVNEEGEEIAPQRTEKFKYKDIYSVEADAIEGYTFLESSRKLSGTVMGDMEIILTYAKETGCSANITGNAGAIFLVFVAAAAVVFWKKVKN